MNEFCSVRTDHRLFPVIWTAFQPCLLIGARFSCWLLAKLDFGVPRLAYNVDLGNTCLLIPARVFVSTGVPVTLGSDYNLNAYFGSRVSPSFPFSLSFSSSFSVPRPSISGHSRTASKLLHDCTIARTCTDS